MRSGWRAALTLLGMGALGPGAFSGTDSRSSETAVTFGSAGEVAGGLVFRPPGTGPFPAVVVIHQWWGVDDWIKDQARALAREGYLALAVDLYRGTVTHDEAEAHQYMMGLPADRALRDLRAAVSYLQRRSDVRRGKVGAIGWSMGGRYALDLATAEPALAAVVVYYGALPTDRAAIARIRAPVLGHFGGDDQGPSPDQVTAFEAAMKRAGRSVDVELYEGAPHAFADRDSPWGGYREAAARDAWARTVAFFAKTLGK